jgi:lipoate-protein ligase B
MVPVSRNSHLCHAFHLGVIDYEEALRLQNNLVRARGKGDLGDILLILEHPSVITVGRSGKQQNILASQATLQEKNIQIVFTDRGGDVTYHGPGQIIAYPILDLNQYGLNVPDYVWSLEEVVIRLLQHFGIEGRRIEKLRGVWVGKEKICSLGVHLSHWISKHGLALNVNTDLDPFRLINPCGLTDCQLTSMARIVGEVLPMEEIEAQMLQKFQEVFGFTFQEGPRAVLESYR